MDNPNDVSVEFIENIPVIQEMMQDAEKYRKFKEKFEPLVLKDKVILSEGVWNENYYTADEIRSAVINTDWTSKENRSLFLDHKDNETSEWVGFVDNVKYDPNRGAVADLSIIDPNIALKLAWGAKFAISPKVSGELDEEEDPPRIRDFTFLNNSIVINPACKTTWINNSEVKQMEKEEKKVELSDKIEELEKRLALLEEENKKLKLEAEKVEEDKPEEKEEPKKEEEPVEEKKEEEKEEKKEEPTKEEEEEPEEESEEKEELSENSKIKELEEEVKELKEKLNKPIKLTEKTAEPKKKEKALIDQLRDKSNEEINELMGIHMLKKQGSLNLRKGD